MYKTLTKLFALAFICIFALTYNSNAQLPAGSFGIGASFITDGPVASGFFALSENLDIGVGLGYVNNSFDSDASESSPDPETTLMFQGMGRFFLANGRDVSPYLGALLNFTSFPSTESPSVKTSENEFGFAALFGGQAFIAKNFAVYGHIALGFSTRSKTSDYTDSQATDVTEKYTTISLMGSSVGAIFYFGD